MRRLVDIRTGAELKVGDHVVSFGGTPMRLTHIDPVHNRVRAIEADESTDFEFFPGVFWAQFVADVAQDRSGRQ
jgi:hypothetical protein